MGTSLTGLTPATTYDALIKVGDNGPIDATLKALSDGLGNNLPMEVSTETVNFTKGASANQFFEGLLSTTASGTQVVLTINSVGNHLVTGSGGQTFKLPDATTLPNGAIYYFNNNQSSGAISVNNNSNTLVASIPSGGFTAITLLSNATAAGTWERHEQAPSNVTWSTNTFDYPGSITSATWNGVAIADAKIASAATWNAKQSTITGAATTITTSDLTASRALTSNASGKVAVATTTSTELGYVNGVTSAIQTQIDAKQQTLSTVTTAQSLNGQVLQNFIPNQASTSVNLTLNSANAATYNSSVITLTGALTITFDASLPNGFNVTLIQLDAAISSIAGTGGLVIGNRQGHSKNNGQYSVVSIIKYTNVLAILGGDTSV
jgi:hypothetical protein